MPTNIPVRSWTSPELTSIGRLPMRSPHLPCPDAATARAVTPASTSSTDREATPWALSLDGRWRFALLDRPDRTPPSWELPGFDDSAWSVIAVPGNWTTQGWDRPHYTNIEMPFPQRPPEVPVDNPTGLYRRSFTLPRSWRDRRVELHVGGAESVLEVWVNGRFVGMGKDSRLPSDFDITAHCHRGTNTLACRVIRWSDASHLEDQDHWWMAGIHRSVFLTSTASVWIDDIAVRAGLAEPSVVPTPRTRVAGTLDVRCRVGFATADAVAPGWTVRARLETLEGSALVRTPLEGAVPHDTRPYLFSGHTVRLTATVPRVRPWSAEDPQLARLVVELVDPDGAVVEVAAQRVGFRSVEVRDRALLINGAPVPIVGVNRHDHHPDRGKAVTVDDMREDLESMKRHNVNAVRCAHYPNDSRLLDLCDELGLYVVDEANIETHASIFSLCHDDRYRAAWVERVTRMVERDRNHPSVIAWSLGNESGYGPVHDESAAWVRRVDPTRPLHYEGAVGDDLHAPAPVTDLVCPMYPSIEGIVAWSAAAPGLDGARRDARRPLIMCEYSHAMGNSNGSLADYWAAIEAHDGLQGGFVWEWKDHGLTAHTEAGVEFWAYGGQFGDEPNDANFVADGLCAPDGRPHPGLVELAWLARPLRVTATAGDLRRRQVRVTNTSWFADARGLRGDWELAVDGLPVDGGRLRLPAVAPRASVPVNVPFTSPQLAPGEEAVLTVRWTTSADGAWAERGHEVGWDQVSVRSRSRRVDTRSAAALLEAAAGTDAGVGAGVGSVEGVTGNGRDGGGRSARTSRVSMQRVEGDQVEVRAATSAGPLELVVGERTGAIESMAWRGEELWVAPPELTLWRAPIDNDGFKLLLDHPEKELWIGTRGKPLTRWLALGLHDLRRRRVTASVERIGEAVVVDTTDELTGTPMPGVRARGVAGAMVAGAMASHRRRLAVWPSGDLVIEEEVALPEAWADPARLGVRFLLPAGFEHLEWYGLGPYECYADRRASAVLGRWESTVHDHELPYLVPQEYGAHCGTRWLALEHRRAGIGLLVAADGADHGVAGSPPGLTVSALHHTAEDLWAARDATELARRDEVVVQVDLAQRGLGTGSCGPDTLPRYQIRAGLYRWSWRARPYVIGADDPADLARR